LYWSAPLVLNVPVHGPRFGFCTEVHQPEVISPALQALCTLPVALTPSIMYWVRSVSWSEYSAPRLKLCLSIPVLNLPVKASWSVKASVSATRELARAQTFPVNSLVKPALL